MIKRNIQCNNAAFIIRLYKSLMQPRQEYRILAWSPYHKKDMEVRKEYKNWATKMVYGCGDLNYKDRLSLTIAIIRRTNGEGDLIETFKLLKDIAKLDYSIFFKLSVNSKVRGHT